VRKDPYCLGQQVEQLLEYQHLLTEPLLLKLKMKVSREVQRCELLKLEPPRVDFLKQLAILLLSVS